MLKNKKVLVVDDEKDILNIIEFFLKKHGANVLKAPDAFSGLEYIYDSENKIDIVLLDIMLPILDGFQVAKILKMQRDYNKLPIIMLSALGESENIKKGFQVGADEYIVKPASEEFIVDTIKNVLKKNEKLINSGRMYNIKFELKSDFSYIKEINDMAKWIFSNTVAQEQMVSDLIYSLNEMCANAIEHGNRKQVEKKVFVECDVFKNKIIISIKDEGKGFDPVDTLDRLENADMFRMRGRGMLITRSLMDEIEYKENGKKVVMVKKFNS
ncbi:MAG: response regulator [Candidatus Muiribacteriota bacterium]